MNSIVFDSFQIPIRSLLPSKQSRTHTLSSNITSKYRLTSISRDFNIPELEGDVEYYQRQLNARFDTNGKLLDFNEEESPLLRSAPYIYDRSSWGRLRLAGKGALQFLHNRTTNACTEVEEGQGLDTVFLQSKGRIIDLATAYMLGNSILLILSPSVQDILMENLEKYMFPGDEVKLVDVRSSTRLFSLIGPESRELLSLLNVQDRILDGTYGDHEIVAFKEAPVIVAKGNELNRTEGYTLIADDSISGDLYKNLVDAGALPIGYLDWEKLRISKGRPKLENELASALNPFEVGLFHAISLDKGCFLGQESISRIYTKNAIRKSLWAVQFSSLAPEINSGDSVTKEGTEVGIVTSGVITIPKQGSMEQLALVLLRTSVAKQKMNWEGSEVEIQGTKGFIKKLEYTNQDFVDGVGAPRTESVPQSTGTKLQTKDEKMKEMQAKLDAFMKQHKEQE